ncbi:corrinoid protein [Desulfoluna spongiiphila]|uniref:5-methyltetrahydrofolate--homocysteine methyltransferase n=1 Tax=Desulfoluna spongiiphila TaxID=419481 RepID=A0A1G5FV67_9BACT|nr:corrinoid protein [Desulfoluna spongiiphila]SCY43215.1 5-methyltetrahydrofolate--homocysteine methyltransferase [Desulfoluna spongiiphila]VVS91349.1 methionine synthase domain [Desulfoluna spongiiphila]
MSIENIFQAVIGLNADQVVSEVKTELAAGTDVNAILNDGLIKAMDFVGERFSAGETFVPEMLMSAHAMKTGVELLKPHLTGDAQKKVGTIVIGTVDGDLHDIGKNLVCIMLEGAGFNVVDLGVDVKKETFVEMAKEHNADIIGLSTLLTTTMCMVEDTIAAIKEAGIRDSVKILVGGAPLSREYADSIGADAFAADAGSAGKVARDLVLH